MTYSDDELDQEYIPSTESEASYDKNQDIFNNLEEDDEPFNKCDEECKKYKIILLNDNNKKEHLYPIFNMSKKNCKKTISKKRKYEDIVLKYNSNEKGFFNKLNDDDKDKYYKIEKDLEISGYNLPEPLRFKFLDLNIPNNIKNLILSKLEQLNNTLPCSGEYFKLNSWIDALSKIPLGKYHTLPIKNTDDDIALYLQNIKKTIDINVYGHEETKDQIIRILAQWISNPTSNGYIIGIQGSPGVGKTKLIKDGICKAMNYPYSFISLGGISDSSFLNGHTYTYEGATYGKIVESLIKAKVMNPVILFDELDKISKTPKGEEIINTLIHITDPVQNDKYTDKYFEEIDLDLSKSLIIFTYNDEEEINPILKDRMITIRVQGYNTKQKITLCKEYLIPEMLLQYNLSNKDIIFEESLIKQLIDDDGNQEGVRNIKRSINDIISWINMMRYIPTDNKTITLPFTVNTNFYNKYCKKNDKKIDNYILHSMYL